MRTATLSLFATLLVLLTADLVVSEGKPFTKEQQKAIDDAITKARNDSGRKGKEKNLEAYTRMVIDNMWDTLNEMEGEWHALIYGHQIPTNCEQTNDCYFELRDELSCPEQNWATGIPADHWDVPYMVVIFTRGYLNKCSDEIETGSHNWWFSFNRLTTMCYTAFPISDDVKEDCKSPKRCYVNWNCDSRSCFHESP